MQVLFQSRDPEAASLRTSVVRRVRFVLRRLSWRVPRADVQLTDINGPRGGMDKRCLIELRTDTGRPIVVSSIGRDWRTVLNDALARAVRHLRRWSQRVAVQRRWRERDGLPPR